MPTKTIYSQEELMLFTLQLTQIFEFNMQRSDYYKELNESCKKINSLINKYMIDEKESFIRQVKLAFVINSVINLLNSCEERTETRGIMALERGKFCRLVNEFEESLENTFKMWENNYQPIFEKNLISENVEGLAVKLNPLKL